MKIILLQDVREVGKKYDLKEVADGYAKNFLIARGLAKLATPDAVKDAERRAAEREKERAARERRLTTLGEILKDRYLEFTLKSDEQGTTFGSVTKEMVLKAMREHNWLGKERVQPKLDHPLKEIGDHEVAVDLGDGTEAKLKIKIRSLS